MKKTARRFLSMLLALSMVFGMLVFPVSAAEDEEPPATVETAENAAPEAETAEEAAPASQEDTEIPIVSVSGRPFDYTRWAQSASITLNSAPVPEDVEVDENDPGILSVSSELKEIRVLNADGESVPLTDGQIQAVLAYFQQYLNILADNTNIYGVQTPFFLNFNDKEEDGLGVLGEMLVLAGYSVADVRAGNYAFMDLVMMIKTFTYTYGLGAEYYADAILSAQKEALQAVKDSGAQTEVQKLLVLNTWLAQNDTFDMPYIMNADSDKSGTVEDDEKIMAAPNGSPKNENYDKVQAYVSEDLEDFFTNMFHDEIKAGFEADLRKSVFEAFIKNIVAEGVLTQMIADEDIRAQAATAYVEEQIWQEAYDNYLENGCDHENASYKFTYDVTEEGQVVATATMTCADCDGQYTDDNCTVTEKSVTPATCTEKGTATYIATATFKDAEGNLIATVDDTEEYTKELPVDTENGHPGITAVFTWNEAGTEATGATATCDACEKEFAADSLKTTETSRTEPTCGDAGQAVMTAEAAFTVNGETVTKTEAKTVTLPATGEHDYDPETGICTVCKQQKPAEDDDTDDGTDDEAVTEEDSDETVSEADADLEVTAVSNEEAEAVLNTGAEATSNSEATTVVHTFTGTVTLNESEDDLDENAKVAADKALDKAREEGVVKQKVGELSKEKVDELTEVMVRGGVKDSEEDQNTKTEYEEQADQQADAFVDENQDAIAEDPAAFLKNLLVQGGAPEEQADAVVAQAEEQAAAVIEQAATEGIQVATLEDGTPVVMTTEEIVQQTMASEKIVDMDGDGEGDTTPNDAIPMYVQGATPGLTDATINGWKGCHIGAFGFGTSVCLGYTMAYTYLIQCMHPEVYGTSDDADMTVTENWKTRDEVYGDDLDASDYLVDSVRVTFNTTTTMYGNEGSFGEVHFWNAVKVDGQWYYIDPCYIDVYVEVMSRDRVETDGNMNHLYFMFSHTSAANMYDGYVNTDFGHDGDGITSLYSTVATDKSYEDAWTSRINCTPYFADDGYVYYIYDSSNLLAMMDKMNNMNGGSDEEMDFSDFESSFKLVRHALTSSDIDDGDSDFETLINFNAEDEEENAEVQVRSASGEMVKNDLLTELYDRHSTYSAIYPSVEITSVLYGGKVYFNLANCILSYDLDSCDVALVKEYNTVSGLRDNDVDFGGRAFSVVSNGTEGAFTVENHPIAALSLVDGKLTVSIATNFGLISGKKDLTNPAIQLEDGTANGYGYEYEESNYNPSYNSYYSSDEENDNDEFMWSANFVDTLSMSHLAGDSHSYDAVTVDPFCDIDGYTEERCTECGAIKADSRVYDEGTAHEHHYIHFEETYYTKDDSGNWNTGDCYVCTMCGYAVSEPSESLVGQGEEAEAEYERQKAEYDAAVESAGHTYVPTDAEWSEDGTSVTFQNLKCSNVCPTRKDRLDVLLNDDSITKELSEPVTNDEAEMTGYEGECTEGIMAIYTASGEVEEEDGTYSYTATTKIQKEAGEHSYSNDAFTWTENVDEEGNPTGDYTVTAEVLTCEVCGHELKNITATGTLDESKHEDPTCTEDGKDVYVATDFTDEEGNEVDDVTATMEEAIPALGHKYEAHNEDGTGYDDTEEWNEDHTSVTVTFQCFNEGDDAEPVQVTVTTEESEDGVVNDPTSTDADCVTAGTITYSATVTLDGVEYTVEDIVTGKALGHDYDEPVWDWEDDYSAATVSMTCTREGCTEETEGHMLTTEAEVKSETTEATCTAAGKTVYTATATLNGTEYEDQQEVTIPQLSHDYSEPTFTWSEDGHSCEASYTCSVGGETETEECIVTSETEDATCTEAGTVIYTATVEVDGKTYTDTKTIEGKPLGHTYGDPEWTWAEDYSEATVSMTCTREGCTEETEEHTLTAEATVTSETTKEPTCTKEGEAVHTATATLNGETYTDEKTEVIDATGHDFDENGVCKVCDYGNVRRISGQTRYDTALAIADELMQEQNVTSFKTIVVACGANFPDALAGSYLASQNDAPILLVQDKDNSEINAKILSYIDKNLRPDGMVYILGGNGSVPETFENDLEEAGIAFRRLSGMTRYDTNLKILEEAKLNGNEILVCSGVGFADALSVSAVNKPILLVNGKNTKLADAQKEYLDTLGDGYTFYIIGGTGTVSAELEAVFETYGTVERISGMDRQATSVAVAEKFFGNVSCATLAYSMNFPDGLCGGPLASKLGAPLLLVNPGKGETAATEYVKANDITKGIVFGGTAGITDDAVRAIFDLEEDMEIG